MLVQYNAVPVYIYGVTGSFRLSFYMLIYKVHIFILNVCVVYIYGVTGSFRLSFYMLIHKVHIFILSVCVNGKYNVYMYILTSDILSSQVCRAKGYTICSLCGGACRYLTL
jgi:hypothetical protein